VTDANATQFGLSMLSPEARAAVAGAPGRVSLREARRIAYDTPGLSRTQQAQLDTWVKKYEAKLRTEQTIAVNRRGTADYERTEEVDDETRAARLDLAETARAVETGNATPAELRAAVARAERIVRSARETAADLDRAAAERARIAGSDPAEIQEEHLARFPLLRQSLPALLGELPKPAASADRTKLFGERTWPNYGSTVSSKADELYAATRGALDALEQAERRERLLSKATPVPADALPAMRSRAAATAGTNTGDAPITFAAE
jgi:hypothetical protein